MSYTQTSAYGRAPSMMDAANPRRPTVNQLPDDIRMALKEWHEQGRLGSFVPGMNGGGMESATPNSAPQPVDQYSLPPGMGAPTPQRPQQPRPPYGNAREVPLPGRFVDPARYEERQPNTMPEPGGVPQQQPSTTPEPGGYPRRTPHYHWGEDQWVNLWDNTLGAIPSALGGVGNAIQDWSRNANWTHSNGDGTGLAKYLPAGMRPVHGDMDPNANARRIAGLRQNAMQRYMMQNGRPG